MECSGVKFTRHGLERMFEREVSPSAVLRIVNEGEVIASYLEDLPFPSVLLLGFDGARPLHVLVARDPQTGVCFVVTVCPPDPQLWSADFRSRR